MLLIQQSSSFRVWTSRALMVYFRRALLFLVVSPQQFINNSDCLLQQQQQKVYFSDAEDDEDICMIDDQRRLVKSLFDRNENSSNRIQINQSKRDLFKEYVFRKRCQGLNNSMRKAIENDTTNFLLIESIDESSSDQTSRIFDAIQSLVTEQLELSTSNSNQDSNSFSMKIINNTKINENKVSHDSVYHYQTDTLPSYDPYFNYTNATLSYPSCPSCLPLSSIYYSFDNELSPSKSLAQYSSTSVQQNLSQSADDENGIYEKYQTSFSHILREEDKLQSMLILEPNTSIITVRQLTYHPSNPNSINYSTSTTHICVRLIANPTDLSIQCDTKLIGCKKPLLNNEQEEKLNLKNSLRTLTNQFDHQQSSNKKLQATSIL